jgi:hypothetical protein
MKKVIILFAFVAIVSIFASCTEETVTPQTDPASGKTETNDAKWN